MLKLKSIITLSLIGCSASAFAINADIASQDTTINVTKTLQLYVDNAKQPLILVDDVITKDVSNLDMSNIASIKLLNKETPISHYGKSGANGILLITTKGYAAEQAKIAQTPENQLLCLKGQMEKATSDSQKASILKSVAQTGTFQSLMYAAQYLNDASLKNTAAEVVKDIAINHPEYNGINTRSYLKLAQKILNNKIATKEIKDYLKKVGTKEKGFVSIFNGKDLTGWKGLVEDPIKRPKMTPKELAEKQIKADENMRKDWAVKDGAVTYVGSGYDNLCTVKQYGNFEMYVDWILDSNGSDPDAGIYLRGTPQVQIWDVTRVNVGAQVGSGGLYNNQKNPSAPLKVADNPLNHWNSFYIKMVGDKVTVKLNGVTVVDNVTLENYWDRSQPIFPKEQIELQAHGSICSFKNIYIKEL
ncbi:MAG: family 16 glycoside hydrolase [Phocaeicola sp.]|uniref:3-keto-disaccharide hydrolase n=1 Tax=Phocaeicola sp. TaxID=2773926 RepID=UPI003F9F38CF